MISTDPKAGTQLKKGDTVTVVVSKGKAPIQVPNVVGQNINDVRRQLQGLGLSVNERYKDSDQPADTVIAQTPAPGSGAAPNATVTLDVSKGPPTVAVPDVGNQPCQQAQQTLQQAGPAGRSSTSTRTASSGARTRRRAPRSRARPWCS